MRAGVSSGDITPPQGVELGGYPYVTRQNTGVHDRLHAGALYLAAPDGSDVVVIVTDLFWITRPQGDRLRERASRASGVASDRIIVTGSHTHSAPWMSAAFEALPGRSAFTVTVDDGYVDDVIETCARLAGEAVAGAFDATLAHGVVTCGHESGIGGNRRDPERGPVDAEVPALVVRDHGGATRAVWTKYAMHPTILHADNTLVSADFPSAMRAAVAERHPEAVFLYSMGTAGDQSPRYYRRGQTFEEADRYGRILGEAVLAAAEAATDLPGRRLRMACVDVDLSTKSYPEPGVIAERIERLKAHERDLEARSAPYPERQTASLSLLGAECDWVNATAQADGRLIDRFDASAPFTVTVLALDDLALVFLPGEVFCDFGLEIKGRSPFPTTHVVTMANGDLPGYCVTAQALDEGGYEPGNSILAAESGDQFVEAASALLNQTHSAEERP